MASPANSSDSSSSIAAAPPPAPTSVVQTVNIRSHVPVMLDMAESNYTQRRCFLDSVLGKFGLKDHVHSPPLPDQRDADWIVNDHSVVNWLYTTINKSVFDNMYRPRASAFSVWSDIEGLFRDNELQRTVYLEAEFRSIVQGDMSIS